MYGYTIFHDKIMETLIDSIKNNKSSNAYIFEGAKGLYINECAKLFAMALTCQSTQPPCCNCSSCIQARALTNPDISFVTPPKDKKTIDVDTIRKINEDALIKPFAAKRKVYIIEDGDIMTPAAQNAFLKTFEEPPEYAVFIISVENSDNLLQTIISRATLIKFSPVANERIMQYISNKYPEEADRAVFLTNYCEGVPGRIDEIVSDEQFEALRSNALSTLDSLLSSDYEKAFAIEDFIKENSDNTQLIFDFWISFLRDMLVLQCGAFDSVINVDKLSEIKRLTEYTDEKKISNAIDILIEGKHMLSRYVKNTAVALRCALKI